MIELNKLKSGQLICKLKSDNQISSVYKFLGYDLETLIVLMQKQASENEIKICRMESNQKEWVLFPKKFLKYLIKPLISSPKFTGKMENQNEMTAEKFFGKVNKEDLKNIPPVKAPGLNLTSPELPDPPTEEGQGGGRGHWV